MKPKLAILFESSPFDRKGMFNAIHEKVKRIIAEGTFEVEAFCIHSRDNALTRKIRHTPECPRTDSVTIGGVTYRLLWYPFTITDFLLVDKLSLKPCFFSRFLRRILPLFKDFDLIEAHSTTAGVVALQARSAYGIPYVVTWHGSDIHTHPWKNALVMEATRKVIRSASCNIFVSRALMQASRLIVEDAPSRVIFNGVSEAFRPMEPRQREISRRRFNIAGDVRVVAFVGNLHPVKNVLALPDIFRNISEKYGRKVIYWIIGDGKPRRGLERKLKETVPDLPVILWGNVPSGRMPEMMNCIDLLILPSLNEGLPLVCCEALGCGCNVVASDVGGVSEVVGREFVTGLGDTFTGDIAALAGDVLRRRETSGHGFQTLAPCFDWDVSCRAEVSLLKEVAGL